MGSTVAGMLPRTFVHVPGIGPVTERALWERGITSWQQFLERPPSISIPLRYRSQAYQLIAQSDEALRNADVAFFGRHLPPGEWWRVYADFESTAVFLDIETTGFSRYGDEITLIGLLDGKYRQMHTLLSGYNLERVGDLLSRYAIVVTFNGTLFDLPFLLAKFPALRLPPIHLDLRYLLKRLGHVGGLKRIEQELGIRRSTEIASVDGFMATVLWARYQRGDRAALDQLVNYNAADVKNLQSLMRYSYQQLAARLLQKAPLAAPRAGL